MGKSWKVILLIFLAGCWSAEVAGAADTPEIPEVWTVREAVRFALDNNPDVAVLRYNLEAAQAAVTTAKSSLYPQLEVAARYGQTDNPMYSFGNILNQGAFSQTIDFNSPGRTDDLNLGFRLGYLLYNGGGRQAGIVAADEESAAARAEAAATRNQLSFQVVQAYNLIVRGEGVVKAYESALAAIDASLEVARARYDEGVLLRADVLDLEVQQSRFRENLIKSRNALDNGRRMFLNLMGLNDGPVSVNTDGTEGQEVPEARDFGGRPELRRVKAMVRAAEAGVKQAGAAGSPVVEGFAGYDLDLGTITGGSGNSWQAGVKLSYNLFDGQRASSTENRAAARLAAARARQRKVELALALEVRQAELSLDDARTRLLVAEKAVEQAEEGARISRARFREGDILASDLVGVENGLTDARLRMTIAGTAKNIAIADLRRSLGMPQF